jgi:hypothetical protein
MHLEHDATALAATLTREPPRNLNPAEIANDVFRRHTRQQLANLVSKVSMCNVLSQI